MSEWATGGAILFFIFAGGGLLILALTVLSWVVFANLLSKKKSNKTYNILFKIHAGILFSAIALSVLGYVCLQIAMLINTTDSIWNWLYAGGFLGGMGLIGISWITTIIGGCYLIKQHRIDKKVRKES